MWRCKMFYDYIVVGSGPSGAVLSKTLSDDKRNSVLLIEAGENNDRDPVIMNSAADPMYYYPKYFWQGESMPQEKLNGKRFYWTTGRLLGGGSSVNMQQYVRPTPCVYSQWERLLGYIWSPEAAINNFKELEKYNGETNNPNVHGYNGRTNIRMVPEVVPRMTKKFVSAIEGATGFPEILDYNDPSTPIGPFAKWQVYQKPNGQRESSSTAFLSDDVMTPDGFGVGGRKLRVLTKTTALRILFDMNRVAIGIEILREGHCEVVYGLKKIIICAGINSPQLLLQSGIGPSHELRKAGVPVIFDNQNVGKNMANHTINFASFTVNNDDISELSLEPDSIYLGGAFLPEPFNINENRRSVQLIGSYSNGLFRIIILNLNPQSRGTVKIQNNDPLKIALADEGALQNPKDIQVIKGILKNYIKNIALKLNSIDPAYELVSPTLEVIDDDKLLEDYIEKGLAISYHQESTLRMGPYNGGGVVDNIGRVYGVHNLIVADNSIVPFTVDGNTASSAFLIGYTIAKQLLQERFLC